MLAKLTAKNQLTLPKRITNELGPVEYFDVEIRNGEVVLTPVRIQRADAVPRGTGNSCSFARDAPLAPEFEGIDQVDAAVFKVGNISGRHRQAVAVGNCSNLAIGHTRRKSEFLAITHHFTVEACRSFVVCEHALIKASTNERFETFAKFRPAFALRQDTQTIGDLANGDGGHVELLLSCHTKDVVTVDSYPYHLIETYTATACWTTTSISPKWTNWMRMCR